MNESKWKICQGCGHLMWSDPRALYCGSTPTEGCCCQSCSKTIMFSQITHLIEKEKADD